MAVKLATVIKFVSRLNLSGTKVNREAGIIRSVSLISLGEARGHDKQVDQKTLETVRDCAKEYGDGLRVKFNPNTFTHGAGMLAGRIPVSTIRVESGKTVGDLHLYRSMPAEAKEYLYEICEETPGNIGLSIEFTGDDEEIDGQKFARCGEIFSAVIVDIPAANPTGLFSVPEFQNLTTVRDNINPESNTTLMKPEELKQLVESNEFKSAIKTIFSECMPAASDDKEKEEKAAGVTDKDDDATKQKKVSEYRAGMRKVGDLTGAELSELIAKGNMQHFRQTGGKPAKVSESDGDTKTGPQRFEARVQGIMDGGCARKSVAINRARQDSPAEYNEWMAAQHPTANAKQQMTRK